MATLQDLIAKTQAAEIEAREKQLKQADLARSYLQQIVDIYGPGGAYGKGMEMVLGAQKRQDVGQAAQRGISTGLYGIRDYGAEWESTVGTKARATLEDIRMERRAQALGGLAGFEAGIQYEGPDYSSLMQAAAAQGGAGYIGDPYATQREAVRREAEVTRQSQKEFARRYGLYGEGEGGGATQAPTTTRATGYGAGPGAAWAGREQGYLPMPSTVRPSGTTAPASPGALPTAAPKGDISAQIRAAKTWEEVVAISQAAGLNPGTKKEWEVARRYYGGSFGGGGGGKFGAYGSTGTF